MLQLISIFIGYLLGCFQTSFLIGRVFNKVDIRELGSGNAGTTNAIRVLGWKAGVLTFLGDFLKAVVAIVLVRIVFDGQAYALYAGLGVILGHNFPFYLMFKGGKGIAATAGVLTAFDYRIALVACLLFIAIVALTRLVSLGSLLLATWIPVGMYLFYRQNIEIIVLGFVFMFLAFYRHKANIKRLIQGNENKLGQKKLT
ncbi:glycerol-3-phosphate acyltransferase PlsY [Natranaerovirga hydrolytica]|uniref:Glycerol-3-phosphate acyltransferase n=1 Tax=Natranaerovirga hydrolytica TaxID=680378 RepID=A0A4R1N6M9_9FIRM|nr:glycerol-3-phosphate 1-O-acyltransferase PlsY [Natranaerovirga hydrolytica]TCK98293.1 glycerol-3-phosphate acyltransferase PlsY [Natranaerovirga hydrolytica]